jgi:hypothetical protein
MPRLTAFIFAIALGLGITVSSGFAQARRKSVSAKEVNGTYEYCYKGKFKGTCNEIKLLALGNGKLRVAMDLIYPYIDGHGDLSANIGTADGIARIEADSAVFYPYEQECKIIIRFEKPGRITVIEESNGSSCGFGFNVSSDGKYKKVKPGKPIFEERDY